MFEKLRRGDQGTEVVVLQKLLNKKLLPPPYLKEDGDFGGTTFKAVKRFQQTVGQTTSGKVDFYTWIRLYAKQNTVTQATSTTDTSIKKLLPPNVPGKKTLISKSAKYSKEDLSGLSSSVPSWLKIARDEIGVSEIDGIKDNNSKILAYHTATTLSAPHCKRDETPWCSSFVNWVMNKAGYSTTKNAGARSWMKWGKEIKEPKEGAITIIYRSPRKADSRMTSSGNHVAFFISQTPTHLYLLGGNQSDKVKVSKFLKSAYSTIMYRWPTEQKTK